MPYDDLRSFLKTLEEQGQLLRITDEYLPEPDVAAAAKRRRPHGRQRTRAVLRQRQGLHRRPHRDERARLVGQPRPRSRAAQGTGTKDQIDEFIRRWAEFPVAPGWREDPPWAANTHDGRGRRHLQGAAPGPGCSRRPSRHCAWPSPSFAVMKMTGHLESDAASRRCSSIPEIPPRWMSSSRQVAVCALPLSSNASAEANIRLSMPLWANSRATPFRKPALSSTTITTVGCAAISVSRPQCGMCPGWWATLDLDQRNLVHCEQSGCVERRPELRGKAENICSD